MVKPNYGMVHKTKKVILDVIIVNSNHEILSFKVLL